MIIGEKTKLRMKKLSYFSVSHILTDNYLNCFCLTGNTAEAFCEWSSGVIKRGSV